MPGNMPRKKILLAGQQSSGKTCLCRCMRYNTFSPEYLPTIGVDFIRFDPDLSLLDTAGNPGGKTLSLQFARDLSALVLCVDLTADLEAQKAYLEEFIQKTKDSLCPIILVGTKSDCAESERKVTPEDLTTWGQTLRAKVFIVSAKNNDGINPLKTELGIVIPLIDKIKPQLDAVRSKIDQLKQRYETTTGKAPYETATTLARALDAAIETYSKDKNEENLKTAFRNAIQIARPVFAKHRGWHGLNIALRIFLGVLAGATLIPGIAVHLTTKKGYKDTFFSTPKTDSEKKLDELETALNTSTGKPPAT